MNSMIPVSSPSGSADIGVSVTQRNRVLRNTYWLLALSTVSYTHLTLPTKRIV